MTDSPLGSLSSASLHAPQPPTENGRQDRREDWRKDVLDLLENLPEHPYGRLIQQSLMAIVQLSRIEAERLDWKIVAGALQDMVKAFDVFHAHRSMRKVAIFGSARLGETDTIYQLAQQFAAQMVQRGFMVLTGGGGGVMQAANRGAGLEQSFGLNIRLPFEQKANPYLHPDRQLEFKYFFTRKLFFVREGHALACFPGGFGTLDELFECITLAQTGRSVPLPLVLIDQPGGDYWQSWDRYIREQLVVRGLIHPGDVYLYHMTDNLEQACALICQFYRVYHSSRYVGHRLLIRLNWELSDRQVADLNDQFQDLLVQGWIEKSHPEDIPPEVKGDRDACLPGLLLHFNQRDLNRLYQLISTINQIGESV